MTIRDAELKDARQIAKVHVESWQAAYRGSMPDELLDSLSVDQREAFWAEMLSSGQQQILVLLDQDNVIGWMAFGPAQRTLSTTKRIP